MPKVYIAHGFAEGPQISKRLRAALRNSGLDVTQDCAEADTVIAHSSGCFEIPRTFRGKTVLLAGPATGFAGSSPTKTQASKVRHDLGLAIRERKLARWLLKSWWNTAYLVRIAPQVKRYLRGAIELQQTLPALNADRVFVILYKDDPWSWYFPEGITDRYPNYCFLSWTGSHDDVWSNPNGYISILKYVYET